MELVHCKKPISLFILIIFLDSLSQRASCYPSYRFLDNQNENYNNDEQNNNDNESETGDVPEKPATNFILKDDETKTQTFNCSGSLSGICLFQLNPTKSFSGILEVTVYFPKDEDIDSLSLNKDSQYPVLMCNQNTSQCDYTGYFLGLRNLSVRSTFTASTLTYITISTISFSNVTMKIDIKFVVGQQCVNSNCGKNGKCVTFPDTTSNCVCDTAHGGKNCDAIINLVNQNEFYSLNIPPLTQQNILYTFSSDLPTLLKNKQLKMKVSGPTNPKCIVLIIDSDSQYQNGSLTSIQNYEVSINSLFQSAVPKSSRLLTTQQSSSGYFNLLFIASNNSPVDQFISIELDVTDSTSNEDTEEKYFIYILIGLLILMVIILLLSCFYFVRRRRLFNSRQEELQLQSGDEINNIQQNAVCQSLFSKKPKEDFKEYLRFLNKTIPSDKMVDKKLQAIINEQNAKEQNDLDDDNSQCTCSICIQAIEVGQTYRMAMCNHYFHLDCFDAWIKKQKNCPMCRSPHEMQDLQKFIENNRRISNTEKHKIKGLEIEFEMFENPQNHKKIGDITGQLSGRSLTGSQSFPVNNNIMNNNSGIDCDQSMIEQKEENFIFDCPNSSRNLRQQPQINNNKTKKRYRKNQDTNQIIIIHEELNDDDENKSEQFNSLQFHYNFSLQQIAQAQYMKSRYKNFDQSFIK